MKTYQITATVTADELLGPGAVFVTDSFVETAGPMLVHLNTSDPNVAFLARKKPNAHRVFIQDGDHYANFVLLNDGRWRVDDYSTDCPATIGDAIGFSFEGCKWE